jgi:hypothetical protein
VDQILGTLLTMLTKLNRYGMKLSIKAIPREDLCPVKQDSMPLGLCTM